MRNQLARYSIYVLVAGGALVACQKKEEKQAPVIRPVKSVVVSRAQSYTMRNFPGRVLAGKEAKLSFEVTGRLIALPINEGQMVQPNELIARIDPKKYKETVNETHAKYLEALAQYDRGKKLVKDRYISEARYDALKANYEVAKANYGNAKHDLTDTYLKAPFKGVIARKYVDNFEFVKAKQVIAELHNTGYVDIEIDVPENIMINLSHEADREDQHRPKAIFNARPHEKFPLKFKEVTTTADSKTQTYRIVFTMQRPNDLNVLPGMNVNVEVAIPDFSSPKHQFYMLPSAAVFMSKDNKPMVWIVDPKTMKVKAQDVKVTRMSHDQIKVISGVKSGERVVTAGAHYLKPGQKVRLLKSTDEG